MTNIVDEVVYRQFFARQIANEGWARLRRIRVVGKARDMEGSGGRFRLLHSARSVSEIARFTQ